MPVSHHAHTQQRPVGSAATTRLVAQQQGTTEKPMHLFVRICVGPTTEQCRPATIRSVPSIGTVRRAYHCHGDRSPARFVVRRGGRLSARAQFDHGWAVSHDTDGPTDRNHGEAGVAIDRPSDSDPLPWSPPGVRTGSGPAVDGVRVWIHD